MSLLNTYMEKEQQLKQLQEELDKLQNDDRLKLSWVSRPTLKL